MKIETNRLLQVANNNNNPNQTIYSKLGTELDKHTIKEKCDYLCELKAKTSLNYYLDQQIMSYIMIRQTSDNIFKTKKEK